MAQRAQSRKVGTRENFFGFLTEKKVTYHRDVASERKKLRAGEIEERKHRLALKKIAAEEKAADRKIAAAEQKIAAAEKKVDKGGMPESQFEAMKARMEKEIEAQERHKKAAQAKKNPTWGYGIYQGAGFGVKQVAHFKSKAAAETFARSSGLKGYSIKRAFPKGENPQGEYSVFIGNQGWKYGFSSLAAAREYVRAHPGKRYDIHKGAKLVDSGRVHPGKPGTTPWLVGNPGPSPSSRIGHKWSEFEVQYKKKGAGQFTKWGTYAYKRMADDVAKRVRKEGHEARVVAVKRNGKRNPAADAQALSTKFHGRKATTSKRVVENLHTHKHLMELGPLVRLVIDTPTGLVAVLNFNTTDPKKIVTLATSERDPKTKKLIGKQLYLRGGDQEINLAGLKMDSPLWIRDKMELGRLHEFKRGDPPLIVDGEQVRGSITYRTRKGMDDFKLIDYWHKAGEETNKKYGPAARALVLYDYPNKKIEFGGGQYAVAGPGILN